MWLQKLSTEETIQWIPESVMPFTFCEEETDGLLRDTWGFPILNLVSSISCLALSLSLCFFSSSS